MNYKHLFKLQALLCLFLIISSCKKDETNPPAEIKSLPYEIGNSWTYKSILIHYYYADSSYKTVIDTDTISDIFKHTIIGTIQLNDTLTTLELDVKDKNDSIVQKLYLLNDSDGLKECAYGLIILKPATQKSNKQFIKKHTSNSINPGELKIISPPNIIYKYPINSTSLWTYTYNQFFATIINKKVIGSEIIKTEAGNFNCFKIKINYGNNEDFNPKYEYISDIGKVKEITDFGKMVTFDQFGKNPKYIKSILTEELISYHIK